MDMQHVREQLSGIEAALAGLREGLSGAGATTGNTWGTGASSIKLTQGGSVAEGRNGLAIEYRGNDRCPYGRSATASRLPFEAIVVHHTSPRHSTDWYVQYQIDGDPARGGHFGYHFYIAPSGRIIQGAPLTKRTNHVKPSGAPQRQALGRHANNTNAIGITCAEAGKPSFQPTQAQLQSLRLLAVALCDVFEIDRRRIYGHGEIQTDRHETEGRSAAESLRGQGPTTFATAAASLETTDDDSDDTPIFEIEMSIEFAGIETVAHVVGEVVEDDDELDPSARVWPAVEPALAELPDGRGSRGYAAAGPARLGYTNQSAIRNRPCTPNLEMCLKQAVDAVYGAGCAINIYSGGQDRKGHGARRTGSIRHDDYGNGGRAADAHVFDRNGRQVKELELAKLGQYWLASHFGGVGLEMRGGGIHLDEWTTPPPGGAMFWTYDYSDGKPWGAQARKLLERGAQGTLP